MATFTRPDKFVPVNISSDPSAYLGYVQKRMDLSAQGEASVKMQYKQLLDLDLTHDSNKDKLNNFLQQTNEQINKFTNTDLSDLNNVRKALSVFDPLTKDKDYQSILYDNKYTKHYNEQFQIAEQFKNKVDKKGNIGEGYSNANFAELQQKYQYFKNADGSNKDTYGDLYSYKPYYNYKDEISSHIKDFIKLPDDYEIETLDPNTGLTRKTKIKGKDASSIQMYLNNIISDKAKDQLLLEGRVIGRTKDDNEFVSGLKQSTINNIKQVQKTIDDLEVFKVDPNNPNISQDEINQKLRDNRSNLEDLNEQLEKFNSPEELSKIINNKAELYSNSYLNQKIASLSTSSDNKRFDQTYGSNSAMVSLLNRNQGFQELQMKLNLQREIAQGDLKFKYDNLYAKEFGIDPRTGQAIKASDIGEKTIVNDPLTTFEDVVKGNDEYETDLSQRLGSSLVNITNDAYRALGLIERNPLNDKKAMSYMFGIAAQYNKGDINLDAILKKSEAELTPEERIKKAIVQKLQGEDATIAEANAYNNKKRELKNKAKLQIINDLAEKGITLDDINQHRNLDKVSSLWSVPLGPYNNLFKSDRTPYGKFNSLNEFAERVISDSDFAKTITDNFKTYGFTTNPGPTITKSSNLPNLKGYSENIQKELSQNYALTSMKEVYSRPIETNTTSEKDRNEQFNSIVAKNYALYKDQYPDQFEGVDLASVQNITTREGQIIMEAYETDLSDKGKVVRTGPIKRIVINDPNVKVTSDIDKTFMRALALSPNGQINRKAQTEFGNYDYTIGTATGTPYSASGVNQNGIIAKIKIGNDYQTLPTTYYTPSDAVLGVNKFFQNLNSEISKLAVQEEFQKNKNLNIDEAKKIIYDKIKSKEIQKDVEKKIEELFSTGDIYRLLGMQNPNLTLSQQTMIDLLENVR